MTSKNLKSTTAALLGLTLASSAFFGACTTEPEAQDLSSLRRSGEATFICVGPDKQGAPLSKCPRGEPADDGGFTVAKPEALLNSPYQLYSLITQTLSDEVAVLRLSGQDQYYDKNGKVLDADRSNPGQTHLRVAGKPVDIVTTPGGLASFVSVSEVGRNGVFGLPTTCIGIPKPGEPRRDLTTWPACSLPTRPGAVEVLLDTNGSDPWCGAAPSADLPYAEDGGSCAVDLSEETEQPGRRKLLVALPEESRVVVLDAQELLDRDPGTYAPCHIESELPLEAVVPPNVVQPLPEDLIPPGGSGAMTYPDLAGTYQASPAGMDELDGTLVIADRSAPVVHLIDARDPCNLEALEPLIATSFEDPTRVVTTSRVAVSPLTPTGKRYVYAVDEFGQELASVIAFDVSPTAVSRTPIVRSGAPLNPFESPDRIEFSSAVKDVAFAMLSRPVADAATGEAISGTLCNPDPNISENSIQAAYRPTSDDEGARPYALRGLFGYALLSDARLALIDIEDFDHECRRPISLNPSSQMDFRGCVNDDPVAPYYTLDGTETGTPTVTNEATCRTVVPHRARSAEYVRTEDSVQAPSLRAFGQLSYQSRGLGVSRLTPNGKNRPILLPVDFPGPEDTVPAQVYVGSILYERLNADAPLVVNPYYAERIAPVLPFVEPRAYPSQQVTSVTYEGALDGERTSGELESFDNALAEFQDESANFCDLGVQGARLTAELGQDQFDLSGEVLAKFAKQHSDYVQISNILYNEEDPYWTNEGAACGDGGDFEGTGYALCDSVFGQGDEDDLAAGRDLRVLAAYQHYLEVTPRGLEGDEAQDVLELAQCCFPTDISYRLRASRQWVVVGASTGFQHKIIPDDSAENSPCIRDTSPLRAHLNGRAFELSSTQCDQLDSEQPNACGVGPRTVEDYVCFYNASGEEGLGVPVEVGGPGDECIFNNLNTRFALYRGLEPSLRGMSFGFETIGGFRSMSISTSYVQTVALPVSLAPVPEFNAMGVVDSQNQGFLMIDLPNSSVGDSYY